MDLGLELSARPLHGRKRQELQAVAVGELTEADLAALGAERGVKPLAIKRLSDRHHALAKALASGMGQSEAAYACGYTPSRVSILCQDDAFKELLHHYRTIVDAAYGDMHEDMAGMSRDAVNLIRDRMEDEPAEIPTTQLLDIAKMGADRTGHGPATQNTHLHIHAGLAQRLEAARKRVARMKDVTPVVPEGDTGLLGAPEGAEAPDKASGTGPANGADGGRTKEDEG